MTNKKNPNEFDYFNEFNAEAESSDKTNEGEIHSSEDFAKLLKDSFKQTSNKKLKIGDKITGKILSLGKDEVYVSTGSRFDGMIRRMDLEKDGSTYKTDDTVTLYVTYIKGSEIRLSKNPTDKNIAEDLEDAFDMMLPIEGKVAEICKGGVRVSIRGKMAFCPIGQLDVTHVETGEEYIGKTFEFRITQFSEGGRNIVVSRKKLLTEERELGSAHFLEENKDGTIVKGRVSKLEKFGAFIELAPGVDGLCHISEIAWSRIGDPSEVLTVSQMVDVKILKREVSEGRARISLSIKQASERPAADPAVTAAASAKADPSARFNVGQILTGKVVRKEVYGFFIEIEPGLNGLLHKSRTFDNPEFKFENIKVGSEITVQISEIKLAEKQIALSLPRDASEDDWKEHVKAATASASVSGFGGAFAQLKDMKVKGTKK